MFQVIMSKIRAGGKNTLWIGRWEKERGLERSVHLCEIVAGRISQNEDLKESALVGGLEPQCQDKSGSFAEFNIFLATTHTRLLTMNNVRSTQANFISTLNAVKRWQKTPKEGGQHIRKQYLWIAVRS